jgi:tetratricopeptide (TPR) repeat protein
MKLQALGQRVTPDNFSEIEEMMALSRQNGNNMEISMALIAGGMAYIVGREYEKGKAYLTELKQRLNPDNKSQLFAFSYYTQAFVARVEGNYAEAERNMVTALEVFDKSKNRRMVATIRSEMAHMHRSQGRVPEAEAFYRQTILSWQEQGHQTAVAHQIECFAYMAIDDGSYSRAARLLGAAGAARTRLNEPSTNPQEIDEHERAMEQLAVAMGEAELDKVLASGALMSLDEAVIFALER